MSAELSLPEAAKHIGVPPHQLHQWTWDKVGPKSDGSLWRPRYKLIDLNDWLRDNRAKMNRVIA